MLGGVQSVVIFTASILATTLVIALLTTMVYSFKRKKRRRKSDMRMMKLNRNTDYGVFFSRAGFQKNLQQLDNMSIILYFDALCLKDSGR